MIRELEYKAGIILIALAVSVLGAYTVCAIYRGSCCD
jgi:hypothetical protein